MRIMSIHGSNDMQLLDVSLKHLAMMREAWEEIDQERGIIISEKRDRETPDYLSYVDFLQFAMPESLISQRLTIGDKEIIATAPREAFMDYYRKWYRPERLVLIAVGDVEGSNILELFEKYFSEMKGEGEVPADPEFGPIENLGQKARVFSHPDLSASEVSIVSKLAIGPRTDTLSARRADMALNIANRMLTRRLERLSRKEDTPLSKGSAYGYRWLDTVAFAGINSVAREGKLEETLQFTRMELERALAHGFLEQEFILARDKAIRDLEEDAAKASTRKSRQLSSSLVRSIIDNQVFMDPAELRDMMVPVLQGMELSEVEEAFRQSWGSDERLIHLSGPLNQEVMEQYEEASEIPEPWQEEGLSELAYNDFGPTGSIVNDAQAEDLGIRMLTFDNGVRLNLKKTEFESGQIRVRISFGQGWSSQPDDFRGMTTYLRGVMEEGGLGKHARTELQDLLQATSIRYDFGVDSDSFYWEGSSLREDLPLLMKLLAAHWTDPGFREEADRRFDNNLDELYRSLETEIGGAFRAKILPWLTGEDSRFGYPSLEAMRAYTMEDAKRLIGPWAGRTEIEVAIVGDFADEAEVVQQVAETFGALTPTESPLPEFSSPNTIRPTVSPSGKTFLFQSQNDRGMAFLVYPSYGFENTTGIRSVNLLAEILTDRMRIKIREELGDAYSAWSQQLTFAGLDDLGFLMFIASVQEDRTEPVMTAMKAIADNLLAGGITEDEFVRAQTPLMKQVEEQVRDNRYWLGSVLSLAQSKPERLEKARSLPTFYGEADVPMMEQVAREILQKDKETPIILVPQR